MIGDRVSRRVVPALVLVALALSSCQVMAPLNHEWELCRYVKEAIQDGSMTLEAAAYWYSRCGPF
jgi:hypothetical protein